jgi:hypothetical protein
MIKSKLFLFGDYEGIRQLLSTATVDIVPSAAARTGHLTSGTVSVDPKVEPYLALYPLPNGPVMGDTGLFTLSTPQNTNEDFLTSRADLTIGKSDSLFGTYMFDNGKTEGPDSFDTDKNYNENRTPQRRPSPLEEFAASAAARPASPPRRSSPWPRRWPDGMCRNPGMLTYDWTKNGAQVINAVSTFFDASADKAKT